VHFGTFKVFVNYIPIADITSVGPEIYKTLLDDAVSIAGIHYCPPDYLRMNMFWNSPPRWRHESMGEGVDEIIFAE
jgi:hypothetical protein